MLEIGFVEKNKINNYIYTGLQIVRPNRTSDSVKCGLYDPRVKGLGLDTRDYWTINENWDKGGNIYGYASKQKFYHVSNLEIFNNLKKEKIITY